MANEDETADDDTATAGAVAAGENQVLLPSLRGLAIDSTVASAMALQQKSEDGVHLECFTENEQAEIKRIALEVIGRPVSLGSLENLSLSSKLR